MAVGFFCGLTADIASMGTLGFYMAVFILAGYLNGAFHRWMYSDYIVFPADRNRLHQPFIRLLRVPV